MRGILIDRIDDGTIVRTRIIDTRGTPALTLITLLLG